MGPRRTVLWKGPLLGRYFAVCDFVAQGRGRGGFGDFSGIIQTHWGTFLVRLVDTFDSEGMGRWRLDRVVRIGEFCCRAYSVITA